MMHDIHCHLTSKEYENPDKILNECKKKDISAILNGLDYEDNIKVLELSKNHSNAYAAIGMHPSNNFDKRIINQIISNEKKIIAIGEVGLDFKKKFSSKQIINFKKIISLAQNLKKPLIIHLRNAEKEIIELTKNLEVPSVLHCFCGKKKLISKANNYFSIPANIIYSEQFKLLAREVPIEKIMCETDSPYLFKEFPNTPLNVKHAYSEIAKIKGITLKQSISKISLNVKKAFKINGFKNN